MNEHGRLRKAGYQERMGKGGQRNQASITPPELGLAGYCPVTTPLATPVTTMEITAKCEFWARWRVREGWIG